MTIEVGDTVRLKSGGPVMRVEAVVDGDRLLCSWGEIQPPPPRPGFPREFDAATGRNADWFALATLEPVDTP